MKKTIYKLFLWFYKLFIKIFNCKKLNRDINISRTQIYNKFTPGEIWTNQDLSYNENNVVYDLTLVVPVYNTALYLEKCVESLVNQKTKYKYQIIFINDGSTDNSLQILEKYKNKYENIKIITQKNGGLSAARNTRN